MMWDVGSKRKTAAWASLLLLMLVMSVWPAPVQAWHAALAGPGEGTTIQGLTPMGFGNLTFLDEQEQLVGYHEWRDVVRTTFDNGAGSPEYIRGPSYDLITGLFAGDRSEFADSAQPFIGLGPLADVVSYGIMGSGTYGGPGADLLLPESLLWGRTLFPGDSWTVQPPPFADPDGGFEVTVEADHWEGPFTVYVTSVSPDASYVFEWRLVVTEDDRAAASERALRTESAETPRDESTWQEYPLAVVSEGGDSLPFHGQSHVRLTSGPDRQMSFGAVSHVPDDPEPHAMFDVGEAAAAALASDHEAVRAFRSGATDPYLAVARLYSAGPGDTDVAWHLAFQAAGANGLEVRLQGHKTPWTPLVVTDVQAQPDVLSGDYLPPEARANTTTVHPGLYARYLDTFAAERDRFATGYDWSLYGWSGGGFAAAGGQVAPLPQNPVQQCAFSVSVAGDTGIVTSSFLVGIGLGSASCGDHPLDLLG